MADVCPGCGASYALVDRNHLCLGGLRGVGAVAPPLPNEALPNSGTSGSSRQARWREKHRGRYNEYQRELMRKRRA